MEKISKNKSYESILEDLLTEKIKIDALRPEVETHRKAVIDYIKQKPSKIKKFESKTEFKFLQYIIENDKNYFIYLTPAQYTEDLAKLYFADRILKSKDAPSNFIKIDYEKNTVIDLDYFTCDGEEINYYDAEIEASTFLYTKLNAQFKIFDTVKFFRFVNISIDTLGYNAVKTALTELLIKIFHKNVIKLVTVEKKGIYTLNTMHDAIEESIKNDLNVELGKNGVEVVALNIRKLSISDATSALIEKQDLEILSVKKKKKVEAEYEKLALENYAKKAEIHTANPNFEVGLTEAEKDLALDRYIKKVKFENGIEETIPENNVFTDRNQGVDSKLNQNPDKVVEQKTKNYAPLLFVLGAIALFIVLVAGFNVGTTLIVLGISAAFFGFGAVLTILKKDAVTETVEEDVDVGKVLFVEAEEEGDSDDE